MHTRRTLFVITLCLLGVLAKNPAFAQKELTTGEIDHLIRAEWKKSNIVPAPPVDDARYLRRIYLDIAGTLPPPDAVKAFLADKTPYKRAAALETLLTSKRYIENWVNYWDDVLMGRQVRQQIVDRVAFRQWLTTQLKKNTPYDKFVYELLTATGTNSAGGSYAKALGMPTPGAMMEMEEAQAKEGTTANINGAVNWHLKYLQTPADYSGTVSRVFLGVQIQCAQCHDHKTEKWKQDDFRRFTACFMQTRIQPIDRNADNKSIRRLELVDTNRPMRVPPRMQEKLKENGRLEYMAARPAALDGTDFANSPNRRMALAKWITAPENPYFAKAIVNRMWAHFMGRGFVDPIDDFRDSNPAVMPELLDRLAQDFALHGYDMKYLIKRICTTQAYQLSSQPARQNESGNPLWARYRLKPMKPEVVMDMLISATNFEPVLERIAGERLPQIKFQMQRQFTFLFDVDEEFEQKDYEGTIPQALLLLNGNIVNNGVSPIPGTALADVLAMSGGDNEKIESLYLRTLSRVPTAKEAKYWTQFLNAPREIASTQNPSAPNRPFQRGKINGGRNVPTDPIGRLTARFNGAATNPKQQAYEDMFWALLNSSEFIFNH
jgi:hypothetical protein